MPLLCSVALAGCTVGPDFKAPTAASPGSWFAWAAPKTPATQQAGKAAEAAPSVPVAAPVDPQWWTVFADPELTALESRVAGANLNVQQVALRMAQSRQQRNIALADQMPSLNGAASYTRELPSQHGLFTAFSPGGSTASTSAASVAGGSGGTAGGIPGSLFAPFSLYQYGFDASWELDLWGRVRREVEAASANVDAAQEAERDALVSALAEVARDYIQLRGIQRDIDIANQTVDIAQQSLKLTQERAASGVTTDLDVRNAEAQLRSDQSQLPQLQQQESATINALSELLGEPPGALRTELAATAPIPPVPPTVPVGMPSDLLLRRPDIRQAVANLHYATADIGVATADFYPRIALSGSISLQALEPKYLGSWASRQYAVGPDITLPIFQGGRLTGTLALRRAQEQEAAIAYRKTVLGAWHEVANAIDAYDAEQRRRDTLAQAVDANRAALRLARDRYRQGVSDFLQVLDVQRALETTELQYAQSTMTVSTDLVALYKALGGGWERDMPQQQQMADAKPASL